MNEPQTQTNESAEPEPVADDSAGTAETSPAEADEALQAEPEGSEPVTLEQLAAERDQCHERWLRSQAELENFRRRAQKDLEDIRKYQGFDLVRDLLPALDNLDRAVTAAAGATAVDELIDGIRMVQQQFEQILTSHGAIPIPAVGESFDPNVHEAVQQLPSADHEPMTVIQELERGYQIAERVIRPSKVIVSAPAD